MLPAWPTALARAALAAAFAGTAWIAYDADRDDRRFFAAWPVSTRLIRAGIKEAL